MSGGGEDHIEHECRRILLYDNAAMESFWATLKRECFGDYAPQTRVEARLMIFDYIEVFYNRQRRHNSLEHLSPVDYETNPRYMKN